MAYRTFAIIKGDTSEIRKYLYQLDGGACRYCGSITDDWQADHILPVFEGGAACDISNFQTLCLDCHNEKTHSFPHHNAISSQAVSIVRMRSVYDLGQQSIVA
ncbi:HNH endonuclease [Hymenobacter polaris]